jgi:hypothetical protein
MSSSSSPPTLSDAPRPNKSTASATYPLPDQTRKASVPTVTAASNHHLPARAGTQMAARDERANPIERAEESSREEHLLENSAAVAAFFHTKRAARRLARPIHPAPILEWSE